MRPYVARRQSGFVLLSLMVFLFVAALLALGDMRTLAVQQTLAASLFSAENTMAETESALSKMEEYAAFEGAELSRTFSQSGASTAKTPSLTNKLATCANSTFSDGSGCTKAYCSLFKYPKCAKKGDDNTADADCTAGVYRHYLQTPQDQCRFCAPPTLNCKARWDEPPNPSATANPWAQFTVNFYRNPNGPDPRSGDYPPEDPTTDVYLTKNFWGMVEYLGWARCNLSDSFPNSTNLDAYESFPTSPASAQARGCRVMRVTVRNQPTTARAPTITLQSTLLVTPNPTPSASAPATGWTLSPIVKEPSTYLAASVPAASGISFGRFGVGNAGLVDAERISWRQIFSN
jgi:hypothetical protein